MFCIPLLYFIYTSGVLGYCNEESCFVLHSKAREAVFEYDINIYIYVYLCTAIYFALGTSYSVQFCLRLGMVLN